MAKSKSKPKSKSKSKPGAKSVTVAGLKRAIEGRKASALAGLYADDAVVQVIDRDNTQQATRAAGQERHRVVFRRRVRTRHDSQGRSRRRGRQPSRLHAKLRISRRYQSLLLSDGRPEGRTDRQTGGRTGLGRLRQHRRPFISRARPLPSAARYCRSGNRSRPARSSPVDRAAARLWPPPYRNAH